MSSKDGGSASHEERPKLTFSSLVQLVRREYSNENNDIGYASAATLVDEALAPLLARSSQWAAVEELDYWFAEYYGDGWLNTRPISVQRIKKRRLELQAMRNEKQR